MDAVLSDKVAKKKLWHSVRNELGLTVQHLLDVFVQANPMLRGVLESIQS
jgi:hypothetical protein